MSRKVKVFSKGKLVQECASVREVSKLLGLSYSSTMNRLSGKHRGYDGLTLSYSEPKMDILVYKDGVMVSVEDSIKQASDYTGLYYKTIKKLLGNGKEYKGWSFDESVDD